MYLVLKSVFCETVCPSLPCAPADDYEACFKTSRTVSRACGAVDDNGYCQLKAPALRGEYVLMTYSVDLVKQGQFVPPVSASVVCECDQEYNKKVSLTVMLTNNIPQRGAQHLSLEVRPLSPLLGSILLCVTIIPQVANLFAPRLCARRRSAQCSTCMKNTAARSRPKYHAPAKAM